MFTGTRILVASTALALLAMPALAADKSAAKANEKAAVKVENKLREKKAAKQADAEAAEKVEAKSVEETEAKPIADAPEKADAEESSASVDEAEPIAEVEQVSYQTARRAPARTISVWRGSAPSVASSPRHVAQRDPSVAEETPFDDEAEHEMPILSEQIQVGNSADADSIVSSSCDTCGNACCCTPFWAHRSSLFGEYLYLQSTGGDVAHAIQQNGVGGAGTTPNGRVGMVDQNFSPAYRVGFTDALDACSSIQGAYTNFHSQSRDIISAQDGVGSTVASLVLHPESLNAGSTSSLIQANNNIDFQLAEIEYRRLLTGGMRHALNYTVGGRYGRIDQHFRQVGDFSQPTGTIDTSTAITFQGGGLRTGLDGQWNFANSGLGFYGKGFISLLFGRANSSYTQVNTTTTIVQAESTWSDNRVVPVLEYEVGINWTSHNNRWQIGAGYYTGFWFNSITTAQYIQAVQSANFVNLGQTLAFDGLVTRLEFRF